MPLTSLVLTLTTPEGACELRHAGLTLGERNGSRIPAVLEADDYRAHDAALESLRRDPRISHLDIVFHDFSDVDAFGPGSLSGGRRRRRRERPHGT